MFVNEENKRKDLKNKLVNAFVYREKYMILTTNTLANYLQIYFNNPNIEDLSIFYKLKDWWLAKKINGNDPNIIFVNALKSTTGSIKENTQCYVESMKVDRYDNTAFTLSKGTQCNIGLMQRAMNRNNIFIKDIGRNTIVSSKNPNTLTITNV